MDEERSDDVQDVEEGMLAPKVELLFKDGLFNLSKVEGLPDKEEMQKWIYSFRTRINPDVWPFYLMGINALYTALGGDSLVTVEYGKHVS